MEGRTTDKPAEAREAPQGNGGSDLSTEAQDPRAHRDAATAEQERLKKATEQLPTVEIVEQPKPVDRAAMEKAADAIEYACNGGWTGAGTDTKAIFNILKDKTEAERKVIDDIFRQKYGKKYGDKGDGSDWGLAEEFKDEMSGDDLRYAMELLNRKDPAPRVMERAALERSPAQTGDGERPGRRTEAKPAPKPVDRNEMEKAADAIEYACNGGWTGAGTDKEAIYAILKDKSQAEIKVIDQIFREKYGKKYGDKGDGSDWGLEDEFRDEMSGADLDKALNLLNKKDGKADDAGRIHTALVERDQWIEGRSDEACEKDIRDTLATMNSKQIEEADKDYQQRYGKSLRDAIMTDPNLSQATKQACEIYLKGTDRRTADDTIMLADIAIKQKDIDMFQEAMRDASPETRKRFLDNDGEKRMKDAFGGIFSDADFYHAREYAEKGSLSTATKIRDNTSWMGDNEKAIEQALKEMSAEERKAYLDGRNLAAGREVPGLSEEQKAQALKTYQEINAALKGAGNDTEVVKWEDQIAVKGGSLVTRLAAHRGSIYDDSMHDVLSTIEEMPEADWKRLKADPEFRKEIEGVLSTYLSEDEMKRARQVLDAKQKAETFDEAKASGRRSVLDAINDNVGIFNNKEKNIYDAIEKMTPEEQRRYREDPEFRKQLDQAVGKALDAGAERDTAMGMLNKVAAGEKPTRGIVEKLNEHASDINTDEAAVIRDMKKAFTEDPTLRERIVNPKTPEDQLLSTQFYNALHRALDTDEYERYAKPLLETGHLSMDVQMELNKGTFDDDEQGAYQDIVALANDKNPAAQAERQKILNDKEYQDKVLGFLSEEERKVALYALEQGKMLPEDVIRSHLLGAGTGEEEVKQALAALTPEQIDQLKKDYARKYGEDLTYSLLDEMGGQDARDVKRLLKDQPTTGREAFNDARDEYYESRDGIGKWWVDNLWDGTGYMTDDAVNKFAKAMSRSSAEFKELTPEQQKELTDQILKNLDLFVESKGAAADMAVDAVIIAAAVAGAKFTGGVSLALLTKTALAGAAFKVAAKSTIMGADYDWASSQVVVDALTGAVDAASIVVGPAQLAQVFRLGEKAAATATTKLLSEGGEQLLRAGAEKQIGKKMFEVVARAISNGAEGVDDKAIKALAREFAREGQEEALAAALKQNLKEAMEQEARTALKRTLTEITLNTEAGAIGGGTSGGIRGVAEWDTAKSVEENLRRVAESTIMGAGMGAAMAGTFTLAFKGLGKTWETVRSAGHEPPPVHPDTDVVVNGQRVRANQEVVTFRADGSPGTATDSGSRLQVSFMRDTDGRMLMLDHSQSGTFVKRAGSDKFERIPFGEPVPIKPGDEVRLGSERGPKLDFSTAPKAEKGLTRAGNEGAAFDDLPAGSPDARLRPGDRTVMMPVPSAPADWHGWKHYSIEMNGRVEKMTKAEMVIGRHGLKADIVLSDPGVSRRHAAVKMTPEGAFIRDLGSTNGTYVNGVKVEGEVKLKPGDRITLGKDGPEIRWKHEPPPPKPEEFKLEIGGQKQPLKKSEVVLGRDPAKADVVMGDAGVSRQHAVVRTGSDGVYIKDLGSTNGTYVNGVKIEGEYKLQPGDRITLGKDGPEIKLFHEPPPELKVPRKPLEYRPHPSGLDPAADAGSVKQSNDFLARHDVREKLRDGFQNVGGVNFIDQAGWFHDTVRPSTVVDRTQDEVLNRAIADAHRRFDRLRGNPQELAKALAQYSKELLEPKGWSGDAVDKGYYALRKEFAGKRVLLGEFIERAARGEGAGVCQHQALLFKVLGDEFGLDVSFVRGYSGTRPPRAGSQVNHAWNEVFIDGKRLVFDPRQQIFGVPYEKLPYHTPGRDMPWLVRKPPDAQPAQGADAAAGRTPPGDVPPPVEPPRIRPEVPQEAPRKLINLDARAGDRIQYQGKSWRVEGYDGNTGDVILVKGGYRPMGAQEFAELNPGRQLKVGERYRVRRSSGAIEEGWRLEGVNPDGSLRMFKEDASRIQVPPADIAEANPHLVRPEAPQPHLDQPMARVGDANVRLDEKQIALRDQPVRLEGRQLGGNSGHDMYLGDVQMPDGSYKEVIFHNAHDLGDGSSKSAVRYRKEMAAYKLNEIIGLDNGFPLTAPREVVIEGQPVRGWIQEQAGDPIEIRLRSLASKRYGGRGSSEDVSRLIREDPHLKRQMEQAFVERLIYGDSDDHALNFVMRDTPQGPKIQNIDLDYAFPPDREPQWLLIGNEGINKRLKADFSEQQLSEATLKKIRDFVSTHDTPAGRQRLVGLGLKPAEVEGVLARARWLADNGRFPKARTLTEYRADLKERGGE